MKHGVFMCSFLLCRKCLSNGLVSWFMVLKLSIFYADYT